MPSILIFDRQRQRREMLVQHLEDAGYKVSGTDEIDFCDRTDCSDYSLVILNMFPDAAQTWDFHTRLKKKYPQLPLMVYVKKNIHPLRAFKQMVASMLSDYHEKQKRKKRTTLRGRKTGTVVIQCGK